MSEIKMEARKIRHSLKALRKEIDDAELQLSMLNIREKAMTEQFNDAVDKVYQKKYGVKAGDIIKSDGEDFRFVRFDSSTPIVNRKLKCGKFSIVEQKLWMYDFKTKSCHNWGDIDL
jgi:hypothetical protein